MAFKERVVSEPERTQLPPSCPAMTFLVWTVFAFGFSCSFSPRLPGPPLPSSVPCVSLPLPEACTSILRISFCSLQLCTPHPWEAASPPSEGRSCAPRCSGKIPRGHPSPSLSVTVDACEFRNLVGSNRSPLVFPPWSASPLPHTCVVVKAPDPLSCFTPSRFGLLSIPQPETPA